MHREAALIRRLGTGTSLSPIDISAQLNTLEILFENNNRPVQELNDRSLAEDSTP